MSSFPTKLKQSDVLNDLVDISVKEESLQQI